MMVYQNQKGLSLVEVLLAVGILGLAGYAFVSIFQESSKSARKIQSKLSTNQDLATLEKYIAKSITTGNLRFFNFNRNNSRMRTVFPMPERCADLSKNQKCKQDTSLLYVKYRPAPSVSIICRLNNGPFIVDLNNETYGPSSKVSNNFKVTSSSNEKRFPEGLVQMAQGQILAFLRPPFGYLVKVTSNPIQYTISQSQFPHGQFNQDCVSRLQSSVVSGNIVYDTSQLYMVELDPLYIGELTGSTGPSSSALDFSSRNYPFQTFNVSLESFGRKIINGKETIGVSGCSFTASNINSFKCEEPIGTQIQGAKKLRIDQKFKISLMSSSQAIQDKSFWYEIISSEQTPTCPEPYDMKCQAKAILLNDIDDIPYLLVSHSEKQTNLISDAFSMLKQDELELLRIRLVLSNNKEEQINVYFP